MFSAEMLLNPREITQSSRRIVMNTRRFRTNIHPLPHLLAWPLPQLPWQIVPPSMELKILIPLKPLVAYFTYKSVRRHQGLRWQSNHLCIWIWIKKTQLKKSENKKRKKKPWDEIVVSTWHSGEVSLLLGGGGGGFWWHYLIARGRDTSFPWSSGNVIQINRHGNRTEQNNLEILPIPRLQNLVSNLGFVNF